MCYVFSFTCCLSPLPSVPALSFPAGKWGKAAADRAGGQRSWSRVFPLVSPVLGHPGAVGWGGKSALQGWTRGGLQPRPGVSLCLTRIEVSIPAGLSLCQDLSQGPAGAFTGAWGAPTGNSGVGTASKATPALRGARSPAWGQKWSVRGGLGSDLGWEEGKGKGGVPVELQCLPPLHPLVFTQPEPGFVVSKATCLPDGKL